MVKIFWALRWNGWVRIGEKWETTEIKWQRFEAKADDDAAAAVGVASSTATDFAIAIAMQLLLLLLLEIPAIHIVFANFGLFILVFGLMKNNSNSRSGSNIAICSTCCCCGSNRISYADCLGPYVSEFPWKWAWKTNYEMVSSPYQQSPAILRFRFVSPRCAHFYSHCVSYSCPDLPRFSPDSWSIVMHHFGLIAPQIVGIKPRPKVMFMLCGSNASPRRFVVQVFVLPPPLPPPLTTADYYLWQFCDIYLHVCLRFYLHWWLRLVQR